MCIFQDLLHTIYSGRLQNSQLKGPDMYYVWNSGLIKINIQNTFKKKCTQSQCIWGSFLFYWYVKWVVNLLQGHKNWMALHGWTVHTCFLYKRIPNTEVVWFFSPFHIGQRKVETRILSTFVDNVNWEKKNSLTLQTTQVFIGSALISRICEG